MSYNQTHIPNVKTLSGGDEYIGFKDNQGNLIGVVGHENDTLVIRGTSDVATPDRPVVIEGLTVSSGGIEFPDNWIIVSCLHIHSTTLASILTDNKIQLIQHIKIIV